MVLLKIVHQTLAFSLEVAMVIAIGYWGFQQGVKSPFFKYALMIFLPGIVMLLWGIFAAPKSHYRLDVPLRLVFAGVLFTLTTISLYQTNKVTLAVIFGASALASLTASYLTGD